MILDHSGSRPFPSRVSPRGAARALLVLAFLALPPGAALAQDMDFSGSEGAGASSYPEPSASSGTSVGAPWAVAFAPRFGLLVPTSELGMFVVGALEIDAFLPVADHRLVIALDVSYTQPGMDGTVSDPAGRVVTPAGYTVDVDELKFGLDVIFRFFTQDKSLIPYVGLGPVLHLLQSTETADIGPGENSETSTEFGVELLGGVDFRLGPGFLLAELRLVYSALDHALTGDANAGAISLGVGYRIGF